MVQWTCLVCSSWCFEQRKQSLGITWLSWFSKPDETPLAARLCSTLKPLILDSAVHVLPATQVTASRPDNPCVVVSPEAFAGSPRLTMSVCVSYLSRMQGLYFWRS